MTIGDIIRKYRKENNMTQEDVAVSLGVSTPAVNKWERGVTMPDIALLSPWPGFSILQQTSFFPLSRICRTRKLETLSKK